MKEYSILLALVEKKTDRGGGRGHLGYLLGSKLHLIIGQKSQKNGLYYMCVFEKKNSTFGGHEPFTSFDIFLKTPIVDRVFFSTFLNDSQS